MYVYMCLYERKDIHIYVHSINSIYTHVHIYMYVCVYILCMGIFKCVDESLKLRSVYL